MTVLLLPARKEARHVSLRAPRFACEIRRRGPVRAVPCPPVRIGWEGRNLRRPLLRRCVAGGFLHAATVAVRGKP